MALSSFAKLGGDSTHDQVSLMRGDRLSVSEEQPDGVIEKVAANRIANWRVGYFEFENERTFRKSSVS